MNDLADELLGSIPTGKAVSTPGPVRFTIIGAPVSHKNGYHVVTIGKRPAIVKSKEALHYERDALLQIPVAARIRLEGPVRVTLMIWYASERPDLDESLILDVMQDRWKPAHGPHKGEKQRALVQHGVYRNDRQVREKHVYHRIDRANPRVDVTVEPLQPQQVDLLA